MANRKEERLRTETLRPKRVPLLEQRSKMGVHVLDGSDKEYYYRWVNELDQYGHRIPRFELGGYEIAPNEVMVGDTGVISHNTSHGTGSKRQTGIDRRGQPMYSILMRIKWEYFDEDFIKKMDKVDATEGDIRRTLEGETGVDGASGVYGDVKLGEKRTIAKRKTRTG